MMTRQWRLFSSARASHSAYGQGSEVNTHRVWLEILLLGTAAACAFALLLATLGAAAGAATGEVGSVSAPEKTYQGMVTCSRCEAKHPANLSTTADRCILACVRGGASFALIDGDRTYILDGDLMTLKQVAGRRASVVGAVKGNTIKVSSVGVA